MCVYASRRQYVLLYAFNLPADMANKKCVMCKKNITKKTPGLECSRCDKIVHADPACAKLSNKQLNTLRNSPGIEWSCEDCITNHTTRSSFLIPEEDEEEDDCASENSTHIQSLDTRKLVQDISREMKKTFREEIRNLESSLELLFNQMRDVEFTIKKQDTKIQDLEHKNQDLQNKNKNFEVRISVLEQRVKNFEQQALSKTLEIAGLPDDSSTDIDKVLYTVASKLNMNVNDIQASQRTPGSKLKPGPILAEMKTKAAQRKWIEAGKKTNLSVGLILPDAAKDKADNRVYIREALTKHLKTLLYEAKIRLGNSYQFVWCKDGNICARESSTSKIHYIHSLQHISKLQNKTKSTSAA